MLKNILFFLFVGTAALSAAQDAPPAKQLVLGNMVFYAVAPDIRAEIKLTESQLKKIVDAFQGSLTIDGDRIMVMMDPSLDMEDCSKQAMKVLDDAQRKRLEEIWIQELGAISIVEESIAKSLKLDDKQKKAANSILEETAKEMMELFMAGHDADTNKKAKALRGKASEQAKSLLTEEQAKAFEAMKGKEFKRKIKESIGL